MILQFSVSNYRCFKGRQTLNLAASSDNSLPENCIETPDVPGLEKKRWLKGVALYGANASGKTSLIEAMLALAAMVRESGKTTDPKEPIEQIEPFALCSGQSQVPSAFSIAFVAEGIRHEYRVAATRERIWHESLRAFPKKVEQLWFNRDYDAKSGTYEWSPERPTGFQRDPQLERYTLSNMLFLSKAVASNRTELEPIFRWFIDRLKGLDLSVRSKLGTGFTLRQLREETLLLPKIVELLRHADLGITGARLVDNKPDTKTLDEIVANAPAEVAESLRKGQWMSPELTHRATGSEDISLPWKSESAGTQRLFALAGPWLDILNNGYTVCIDELETSVHPLMARELLHLIFSEKNTKGAQILFTTHNPLLLDSTLLRRDQVWFTDKDEKGEAHLYPLTDYSPRKGESLARGYMAGRYGAVPFLPSGLLGNLPAHEVLEKTTGDK